MQPILTIALSQCPVTRGGFQSNLDHHLTHIEHSAFLGAQLIVFPELSLTGYELDIANENALKPSDRIFKDLSKASKNNDIIVIAGCPLATQSSKPQIGAVICFPCGNIEFYSKQYLHDGEEQYCLPGEKDYQFTIGEHKIALAVCADFSEPEHSKRAIKKAADVYIASALISPSGYQHDAEILSNIAFRHQIPTLLCNHISTTGGWETCGNNSIWDLNGKLIASSDNNQPGVLLCTMSEVSISGQFYPLTLDTTA
ncbi:carbon-nitrogen hydrolase family protein [Vibrio hepatarius]|uniref:carbon-nitrogen hydrolase family protein n=1 Tax=Vibrio hepatarius TaxID=171383 RepID=UPI001C09D0BB|nr:carbon-nitrogen hydrolase family protein [Vibrio hepatarius]MBU2899328.1 carbon-nitrogen hydrolase family protein [Vibrio hepatarius]